MSARVCCLVSPPPHRSAQSRNSFPCHTPKKRRVDLHAQKQAVVTTFRINTCKSVSKQETLTTFRINTYEKRGEGEGHILTAYPPGHTHNSPSPTFNPT